MMQNIDYIIVLTLCCMLIYSIWLYQDSYDTYKVPINGVVKNVDCVRHVINRHQDEYHCILTIDYIFNNKYLSSSIMTIGGNDYYVGENVKIYVDQDNPIAIYSQNTPKEIQAFIIFIISVFILIIFIGNKSINSHSLAPDEDS